MISLSCLAWLLVIIIQAVAHFGFIGRNDPLNETKSGDEKSGDQRDSPSLKTLHDHANDNYNANDNDADDAVTCSSCTDADASIADSSDFDFKFKSEKNRSSETIAIPSTSEFLLGSDVPFSQSEDEESVSSITCNCYTKLIRKQASLETVDSSFAIQDESELSSKSRSYHDSFSSISASISLEVEQEEGCYDDIDCDSIDDDDDEWRLQLLKDYYGNTTNFLKPTQDDSSTIRSLEPAQSINMLCEKSQRKKDTSACINVNTLMASFSVNEQ